VTTMPGSGQRVTNGAQRGAFVDAAISSSGKIVTDSSTLTNTTIWFVAALSLIVDVRTYERTDVRMDVRSDGWIFLHRVY